MLRERKSNFECMRIVAMLMIIGHHLAIHGVQHALEEDVAYSIWANGSVLNKAFVCLLLPGGQIGVALFFMITGYFYIDRGKNNFSKIILEPLFYGIAISLIYAVLLLSGRGVPLSASSLIHILISFIFNPASGGCWWFVTAYFFLMLISPLLNDFLKRLNRKGMLILIVLFWGLWYTIPYMASNTYIAMHRAIFYYIIGTCCRCFRSEKVVNRACLLGGGQVSVGWLEPYVFILYHGAAARKRILLWE